MRFSALVMYPSRCYYNELEVSMCQSCYQGVSLRGSEHEKFSRPRPHNYFKASWDSYYYDLKFALQ